jgi:hypothetical protein
MSVPGDTANPSASTFTSCFIQGVPDRVVTAYRAGKNFVCPFCGPDAAQLHMTKTVGGIDRHVTRRHAARRDEFNRTRRDTPHVLVIDQIWPQVTSSNPPGRLNRPSRNFPPTEVPPSVVHSRTQQEAGSVKFSAKDVQVEVSGDWGPQLATLIGNLFTEK